MRQLKNLRQNRVVNHATTASFDRKTRQIFGKFNKNHISRPRVYKGAHSLASDQAASTDQLCHQCKTRQLIAIMAALAHVSQA